jgi:small subunit ribosomal protein S20
MPNLDAGRKHVRQTVRRTERNRALTHELKSLKKKLLALIDSKEKEKAVELFKTVISKFDMAAKKDIIHKKNADRNKSRLNKKISAIAKA